MSDPVIEVVDNLVQRVPYAEEIIVGVKTTSGNYVLMVSSNVDLLTLRQIKKQIADMIQTIKIERLAGIQEAGKPTPRATKG